MPQFVLLNHVQSLTLGPSLHIKQFSIPVKTQQSHTHSSKDQEKPIHLLCLKMRKIRGFKLGRPFIRFSKWLIRRTRKHPYKRLNNSHTLSPWKTKLLNWGRCLSTKTKSLCSMKQNVSCRCKGYVPLRQEVHKSSSVPKGYLAVYISCKDGVERVLVPVVYFNHPLFGELLREAESEFGFSQQGGITIPCRFSEFESVKTRIDAAGGRRVMGWLRRC